MALFYPRDEENGGRARRLEPIRRLGSGGRNRTPILGTKTRCLAVRRPPTDRTDDTELAFSRLSGPASGHSHRENEGKRPEQGGGFRRPRRPRYPDLRSWARSSRSAA